MPRDAKTTYRIMSAIKSTNTKPERILGSALWKEGLRYRKHFKIKGKPDFVFTKAKLAVFCDGDFWHGNNWRIRGMKSLEEELSGYKPFWRQKIERNIERDKKVNEHLTKDSWMVLRIWESEIKKDLNKCVQKVKKSYRKRIKS